MGRARNNDPADPDCIGRAGLKTLRLERPDIYSDDLCQSLARRKLRDTGSLRRCVTISCAPLYHLRPGDAVTVRRGDLPGEPVQRYVVRSFTRPIGGGGTMEISAKQV